MSRYKYFIYDNADSMEVSYKDFLISLAYNASQEDCFDVAGMKHPENFSGDVKAEWCLRQFLDTEGEVEIEVNGFFFFRKDMKYVTP